METTNSLSVSARRTPWLVKIGVVFTAIEITIWSIPSGPNIPENALTRALSFNQNHVKPYFNSFMYWSGLWQIWNMFSHDPNAVANEWFNRYTRFDLEYIDGSHETFKYPRMNELSLLDRAVYLRYQKYSEVAHPKVHAFLVGQFLRVLAHDYASRSKGKPVKVRLLESWERIGAPGEANFVYPESQISELGKEQLEDRSYRVSWGDR